jgi:hypothetical protein
VYANRVIGQIVNSRKADNNYALSEMKTGTTNGGETVSSSTASGVNGLDKTLADLENESTWTGLGFDDSNWDFDNKTPEGYPELKLKFN